MDVEKALAAMTFGPMFKEEQQTLDEALIKVTFDDPIPPPFGALILARLDRIIEMMERHWGRERDAR